MVLPFLLAQALDGLEMTAPPLPAGMDGFAVKKADGAETYAVSFTDAGVLVGRRRSFIEAWVSKRVIETCQHPTEGRLVLVDSLWAALPEELKA